MYAPVMSTATTLDYAGTTDPSFTMGDRIAKRRHDLKLDQAQLAVLVGVSRPLISKWERGVSIADVSQAIRLAEVLDCSFGWLCGVDARSRCSSETGRSERHLWAVPDLLGGFDWCEQGELFAANA